MKRAANLFGLVLASLIVASLSACSGNVRTSTPSMPVETIETIQPIDLTANLESNGYEYWDEEQTFVYRWANSDELDGLPCYSTWCNMIHVISSPDCLSVAFEYDELDAYGAVIGHRSDGTNTFEEPDSEYAPGWGFILSDLAATDTFQITSMVCSTEPYDWNLKNTGTSDTETQQDFQQNSTTQDPGLPVGHYETKCERVWVANHDPNQNGTTSIGSWENQCQEVWVNY